VKKRGAGEVKLVGFWGNEKGLNTEKKDAERDKIIESYDWRVLRFPEIKINSEIEVCLLEIKTAISSAS
jgi:very-short-patch-repair endonuclease